MALDYIGKYGVATAIGHAPIIGLINPAKEVLMQLQNH